MFKVGKMIWVNGKKMVLWETARFESYEAASQAAKANAGVPQILKRPEMP